MKKRGMIVSAAAAVILGATAAQAGSAVKKFDGYPVEKSTAVHDYYGFSDTPIKQSIDKTLKTHRKKMASAPKAVLSALDDTMHAARALRKHDTASAEKLLASATASFDQAINDNPALHLVPIADEISIDEIANTPDQIDAAVDTAESALEKHDLAAARTLIDPLRDEMIIATQYLPMDLYPEATKLAEKMLKKGHTQEAIKALQSAFGTLESDVEIIPMPLVRAQAYVDAASALDKSEKAQAKKLLGAAKTELKKAVALGYASKEGKAYETLEDQIDAIGDEIKGKNEVEKLYDKAKASFDSLLKSIEKSKPESTKWLFDNKSKTH